MKLYIGTKLPLSALDPTAAPRVLMAIDNPDTVANLLRGEGYETVSGFIDTAPEDFRLAVDDKMLLGFLGTPITWWLI